MRARSPARRVAGRVRSRLRGLDYRVKRRLRRGAEQRPQVSVIVPVYNVEAYLDECLTSLRNQRYRQLEILVVDDGSPDGSLAIAERHAAEDSRVRIIRQPNGGLGAARNAGIKHATGAYLTFVDSDDVVPPLAIGAMVGSAERTGSDMVVGAALRFNSRRRWQMEWVELHREARLHFPVKEFPEIIRNNYTWGKLYRTSFWKASALWFREGVAYEDQPLITQLYVRAAGIDVLPAIVYEWRQRGDESSLSQQTHTLRDLQDRVSAWDAGAVALRAEAPLNVYEIWLRTLYATHFHWYLKNKSTVDDDYWATLQGGISRVSATAPEGPMRGIEPPRRVAVELARRGLRDDFHEFKRRHGYTAANFPSELEPDGLVLKLPTYDDADVDVPREFYRLEDDEIRLVHRVDSARWTDSGDLQVDGWAYFRSVDLRERPTTITVLLRNDESGEEVEASAVENPHPTVFPPVQDKWADYSRAGFAAHLRIGERLSRPPGRKPGRWTLLVRVQTDRFDRTLPMSVVLPGGSAANLPALSTPDGFWHRTDLGRGRIFRLLHLPRIAVAEQVKAEGGTLRGRLVLNTPGEVTGMRLVNVESEAVENLPYDGADGSGEFSLAVPPALLAQPNSTVEQTAVWSLRARLATGKTLLVTVPAGFEEPVESRSGSSVVSWRPSHRGALTLNVSTTTVVVESASLEGSTLVLAGRAPCLGEAALTLQLVSVKARSLPESTEIAGGRFQVRLPLRRHAWRYGEVTLPSSQYALTFVVQEPDGETAGEAQVSEELNAKFPAGQTADDTSIILTRGAGRALHVQLVPPLAPDARGSYHRNRLEQAHLAVTAAGGAVEERDGLLIETNFGEVAGCNGIGIQRELERRGAQLKVYWTVKDHSVVVPPGGIPLVRNSVEWFEKLRTAKYFIDNMYQPIYHFRPPGQTIIATFHGYPFKVMGAPHWENMQFSQALIDSYQRRAKEWDYLVSPARYATPLLTRNFLYDGEVLEIGYPRNDVLVSAEADDIRAATRASLGIPEHVTAVLYAPTFRDYLSADDHHASMGTFLDPAELVQSLGANHWVLIRGHAFHARTNKRPDTADRVIDVTDYPDPADLYLASDVAILDYSSLRFDFAVTGKPMVFLVPDLELYEGTRGWLLDYRETAPGPLLKTTADVAAALADLDTVVAEYAGAYETFRKSFLDLEDGRASARFVDAVFVPRGDAPAAVEGLGGV